MQEAFLKVNSCSFKIIILIVCFLVVVIIATMIFNQVSNNEAYEKENWEFYTLYAAYVLTMVAAALLTVRAIKDLTRRGKIVIKDIKTG